MTENSSHIIYLPGCWPRKCPTRNLGIMLSRLHFRLWETAWSRPSLSFGVSNLVLASSLVISVTGFFFLKYPHLSNLTRKMGPIKGLTSQAPQGRYKIIPSGRHYINCVIFVTVSSVSTDQRFLFQGSTATEKQKPTHFQSTAMSHH